MHQVRLTGFTYLSCQNVYCQVWMSHHLHLNRTAYISQPASDSNNSHSDETVEVNRDGFGFGSSLLQPSTRPFHAEERDSVLLAVQLGRRSNRRDLLTVLTHLRDPETAFRQLLTTLRVDMNTYLCIILFLGL